MDFNSAECTEGQASCIYKLVTQMCDFKATKDKWKLIKISMRIANDEFGLFYLVNVEMIDINGKILQAEIIRDGQYYFTENV
jgi:hypothetical protein